MDLMTGERLAQVRRARGLSQEELADRLGVSRQAVSKWERGESAPDTDNLIALAQMCDISLDALLLGRGELFPENVPAEPLEEEPERAERRRKKKALLKFPYPVFVALCYLWLGFAFHQWHPGWLLFFTIPLYYGLVSGMD